MSTSLTQVLTMNSDRSGSSRMTVPFQTWSPTRIFRWPLWVQIFLYTTMPESGAWITILSRFSCVRCRSSFFLRTLTSCFESWAAAISFWADRSSLASCRFSSACFRSRACCR